MTLDDLGIRRGRVAATVLLISLVTAGAAGCLGGPIAGAAVLLLAIGLTAGCTALGLRFLRRQLVEPLRATFRSLNELSADDLDTDIEEHGAPLMRTFIRLLNRAGAGIRDRARVSRMDLRSAEAAFDRIHAVVQSLKEGGLVVDFEGRVVLANLAAKELLDVPDGGLEGTLLMDSLDGPLAAGVAHGLGEVLKGKDEIRLANLACGERVFDLAMVRPRSNCPAQDFGAVVVLADVTRNHEIAKLKDELLSSISHELRTPLTNICAFTEILRDMPPDETDEWREFVGIVGDESTRLRTIVDDVLIFCQLQIARPAEMEAAAVSLVRVAEDSVRSLAAAAKRKSIRVTTDYADPAPQARVDPRWMLQAIVRLLDNAIKFTPDGGKVVVRVERDYEHAFVTIGDSGPGVPPAHRESVFDRFQQVGDVLTGKPGGAGLGLAICNRIVQTFGGWVTCDESASGGAEFRIKLPAVADSVNADPAENAPEPITVAARP